jgi:asparagine synthase (glutamine-hydrolysing)
MSGICGQFNLDQAPVVETDLRAMTAMLERRGPQGTGRWRDGPVGFGHTLLATTPELLYERQPFTHADTGCVITADVRLDNRDQLLTALDLSQQRDTTGDAELILVSYLQWGESCLDRLLGDFAFVIWDPRHRVLFCARDHFGMRPLYYHHMIGRHFVFASNARAILVLPQVPYRINNGRVADFLVPELEWIDYNSTFFEGVYRLPPGHQMTVTPTSHDVVEYWKPEPGPKLGFTSDHEYRQGFLEVFTKAVDARLRTPSGSAGSMLSGGMDSGSVVAIGKEILDARGDRQLKTFSAVQRQDVSCAESRAIYAAASMSSISPTLIYPDELDNDFEKLVSGIEEPYDGEFMILKAIFLAAQQQGESVVLDGGAGDVVLSEGTYIARLIRQRQFKQAMAEISGQPRFWGQGSIASGLIRHARKAIVPESLLKRLRGPMYRHRVKGYLEASLVSPDFAALVNIQERFERMRRIFDTGWQPDYATECSNTIRPNVTAGRERYARIAASIGVEACDPYLDKRLVDYCSRLPGRFRLRDGWPKMILREIMADKLPEEVLWCRGKPHLGWVFNTSVANQAINRGEIDIDRLGKELSGYIAPAALKGAWRTFRETGDADQIHKVYVLSVWLRETEQRPAVS